MSAEKKLLEAAKVLRERAEVAYCDCGGPACTPDVGWFREAEITARLYGDSGPARYIAMMTPGVGLALADWLDAEAHRISRTIDGGTGRTWHLPHPAALAVAVAILGGAS